eukprot:CAMPEP_0194270510 /NCGR_PEP_ID=MMETSP0169-20130528/4482_1 /TAXON_ID=218684 /ORGANISM="Corethron pennatum, Strain L29A3" /LENGTH=149 /DNA_ID=CAMNT_0039012587 /DNA_START=645 /DNA_END=1091 /DNA_ORIENTATION=+
MAKSVVDIGKNAADLTKSTYLELEKSFGGLIEDKVSKKIGNDTVEFTNRTYLNLGKRVEDVIEDSVSVLTGSIRAYSWDDTWTEEDEQKGDVKGPYSLDDTWNKEDEQKGDLEGYRGKDGGRDGAFSRPGRRRWSAFLSNVGKARRFKW